MDNQMEENVHGQKLIMNHVYTEGLGSFCLTKSIKYLQGENGSGLGLSVIVLLH